MLLNACGQEPEPAAPGETPTQRAGPGPTIEKPAPEGEPRGLRLGFSSIPPERTSEAYIQAFATAAQYGDVVLIQRTPPWTDFMPGGSVSRETADSTRIERELVAQYGLTLLYAIDPTDGVVQRSRLANLPAGIDPQEGFNNEDIRAAFVAYAAYIARNYQPEYLALGLEINMTYERAPAQYEAFSSLYDEAYRVVKGNSPNTKVFPTWQLEDLEGSFGNVHPPRWELIDQFAGRMDVLAISTYPFLGDVRSAADVRADYYSQLALHWDGEIIIAETAHPSAPVDGRLNVGTEPDQRAYLSRLLTEAEVLGFRMVVWFAALDPAFAGTGATAVFKDIGLRRVDGSNKLAWELWEEWARRPITSP